MRIPRFRTIIGLISGPAIIATGLAAFTLASAGPAAAGQPVTQTLTPPPPSFETCKTVGNGFICEGARTMTYGPDDTGIVCGTGAGAFDIFDQGTHNQHAIRFYNAAGDLTRRVIHDQFFVALRRRFRVLERHCCRAAFGARAAGGPARQVGLPPATWGPLIAG